MVYGREFEQVINGIDGWFLAIQKHGGMDGHYWNEVLSRLWGYIINGLYFVTLSGPSIDLAKAAVSCGDSMSPTWAHCGVGSALTTVHFAADMPNQTGFNQ